MIVIAEGCAMGYGVKGKSTRTHRPRCDADFDEVELSTTLRAMTRPPIRSADAFTIASPSPEPGWHSDWLPRLNRSNAVV
jgi:hypothetical protein